MPLVRLDKIIADTGACSRSQARDRIRRGTVAVDGRPVTDPAARFDPGQVRVTVEGEDMAGPGHLYVMLHKPAGLLSATRDPRRPTVLDLMPEPWRRRGLFPVGRLDRDTRGLLLLTDDGAFAHRVLSPKSRVPKLYEAQVRGAPRQEDVEAFAAGLVLRDGAQCLPARLEPVAGSLVRVEVFEGKYHQVKRMLATRNMPVTALTRLRIGGLWLDESLAPGEYRLLTPEELERVLPGFLSK